MKVALLIFLLYYIASALFTFYLLFKEKGHIDNERLISRIRRKTLLEKGFLDFLQYSLADDEQAPLPQHIDSVKWHEMHEFGKKQAILGIYFHGIMKLDAKMKAEQDKQKSHEIFKGNKPTIQELGKWMLTQQNITKSNDKLFHWCGKIYQKFSQQGLECYILKGQGNNYYYPDLYERIPGDIDVVLNSNRRTILKYCKKRIKKYDIQYRHIDFYKDGIIIEVHFFPVHMNNPLNDRRLQRWFKEHTQEQCHHFVELPHHYGRMPIPTVEFSLISQLGHVLQHELTDGVGLRLVIDYYYLVKAFHRQEKGTGFNYIALTKEFGLYRFAQAMMWVLRDILGMKEEELLVPPDELAGSILWNDILNGGSFGKYHQRKCIAEVSSPVKRFFLIVKRNNRYMKLYPSEVLWDPLIRIWHFTWQLFNR